MKFVRTTGEQLSTKAQVREVQVHLAAEPPHRLLDGAACDLPVEVPRRRTGLLVSSTDGCLTSGFFGE